MDVGCEDRGANDAVQLVSPECWRAAKTWYKHCTPDNLFDRGCVDFSRLEDNRIVELPAIEPVGNAYSGRGYGLKGEYFS